MRERRPPGGGGGMDAKGHVHGLQRFDDVLRRDALFMCLSCIQALRCSCGSHLQYWGRKGGGGQKSTNIGILID